jgi:hypothetical protein
MTDQLQLLAIAAHNRAAAHVAFVEHPARLSSTLSGGLEQWRHSVGRTPRTAVLALVAAATALLESPRCTTLGVDVGRCRVARRRAYANFTMLPTQRRLAETALDISSSATRVSPAFGQQHLVRLALGIAALLMFLLST